MLGKHTGTHSVRERLREAGYDPTDGQVRAVTREVKDRGADGDEITEETLAAVAEANGVDHDPERVPEGPA